MHRGNNLSIILQKTRFPPINVFSDIFLRQNYAIISIFRTVFRKRGLQAPQFFSEAFLSRKHRTKKVEFGRRKSGLAKSFLSKSAGKFSTKPFISLRIKGNQSVGPGEKFVLFWVKWVRNSADLWVLTFFSTEIFGFSALVRLFLLGALNVHRKLALGVI